MATSFTDSMQTPSQIEYKLRSVEAPRYKYVKVSVSNQSVFPIAILPTTSSLVEFRMPNSVYNLSRSFLAYNLNITAPPSGYYNWSHEDVFDLAQSIQFGATGGQFLADVQWCQTLRQYVLKEYKGLDFLVCNASPPIRALSFVPEKLERFHDFLGKSLALVSVPMSIFLGCLSERSGWNVVISSAFVRDLPAEWPHYVTAKCAVEGLAHWAAAQYPQTHSLVVRPPKLLTDQTNTTMGRQGAMAVEQAAAAIVKHLCSSRPSKSIQVLDSF